MTDLTRHDQAVRARYDARETILRSLTGCVDPLIRVDDELDFDLRYLAKRRTFSIHFKSGNFGSNPNTYGLVNPVGSRTLVTVRRINSANGQNVGTFLRVSPSTGLIGAVIPPGATDLCARDTRDFDASPVAQFTMLNSGGPQPDSLTLETDGQGSSLREWSAVPYVLTPGYYLYIQQQVFFSQGNNIHFAWEERDMLPEEASLTR